MSAVDTRSRPSTGRRSRRLPIPRGGGLSEEDWRGRHRAIVGIAWAHAVGVPIYGIVQTHRVGHSILEGGPIAMFALIATLPVLGRRARAAAASAALLTSSAILVHFSKGLIEMHFHFFVMVPIVALYQDWVPFLLAIAYVLIHHGIVGAVSPASVFNHQWGQRHPWKWAGVHALFITAASAVCLATWRMNERIFARQHEAETDLLDEKRVVETLHAIGSDVVAELDITRVAQLVTDAAVSAVGASFGAFFYNVLDKAGERYILYTLSGAPRSAFESFPMPRNTKVFEPTFTGSAVVRIDDVQLDPRYGHSAPYHGMPPGHLPVRSYLAVPVRSRGSSEVLGGLFFGHPDAGVFTERDERLAVGIATQAAIAFDNARLYQAERQAHEAAEGSQARLTLLAETGRLITSALDQDVTLGEIARLAVPTLADASLIDVLDDDGTIRRVTASAGGLEAWADVLSKYPPDPSDVDHPVVKVMNGEPALLVEQVTGDFLERVTNTEPHRAAAAHLATRSAIIVPLVGRGRIYGSLSLITGDTSGRTFGPEDMSLAEEIGRRAGMAVENARLYNQQRTVAESLQHALLPQQLPSIPGFETTARYLPGSPGERVGGDWYDLFEVPGGEIAVVMGDVVGHGIPAASLMAQLRNALRAYVWEGLAPAEVLARSNRLLFGLEPDGMATVLIGLLDPITSALRLANAGHLPLLHVRGGEASFVGERLGPPLGAIPFARYEERKIELRANDTAVLYTDGLVEDRTSPLDAGLEHLREAVLRGAAEIDELCDDVVRSLVGDRVVEDDVAILILRSIPLGATLSLRLPSAPRVLASLRQTLRRWMHEHDLSDDDTRDVLIACGEACNNAIEHGSSSSIGFFDIEAGIDDDLHVMVRNEGSWREPRDDGGGRGLPLMRALMDDVEIDRAANRIEVRMRRRLHRQEVNA